MRTKTCKACRTVNEDFAILCRNCGARIGEPPAPVAGDEAESGATAPVVPPTPTTPMAQPTAAPPMPTRPTSGNDLGFGPPSTPGSMPPQPSAAPPGATPARSSTWIVLAIVAGVVVLGAIAAFVLTRGGGGTVDEINGHPRTDSAMLQQVEESLSTFEFGGISFDVAFYGEGDTPAAMLMTFEGLPAAVTDVPDDVFFQSFPTGITSQQGIDVDFAASVQDSVDGTAFLCAPMSGDAFAQFGAAGGGVGAICVFKGSVIGMIFLMDGTQAPAALGVAHQVSADLS